MGVDVAVLILVDHHAIDGVQVGAFVFAIGSLLIGAIVVLAVLGLAIGAGLVLAICVDIAVFALAISAMFVVLCNVLVVAMGAVLVVAIVIAHFDVRAIEDVVAAAAAANQAFVSYVPSLYEFVPPLAPLAALHLPIFLLGRIAVFDWSPIGCVPFAEEAVLDHDVLLRNA